MIGKRKCPECESEEVVAVEGSGIYMCKECGYSGTNFPETVIEGHYGEEIDDDEDIDELVDDTKVHKVKKKPKKSKGAKKK